MSLQLIRVLPVPDTTQCATAGSSPCNADQLVTALACPHTEAGGRVG